MNTVQMRDRNGGVDFMVRVPKFRLSDVLDGANDTVHPAFIVGGKEVDEIYISKYQNSIHNRLPYSLPFQKAATRISYPDAVRACALKGKGWHLMSNAEWAAIALWCLKNGTLPHGNTKQGAYHADHNERGMTYEDCYTLTGSGPATWAHDHTEDGIFDLCGNVWEWVSGLRIKDGVIQAIADNDVALNVDQSINSPSWQDMIEVSSGKSIKFSCGDGLKFTTGEIKHDWDGDAWENIKTDFEITEQMKALAMFPGEPKAGLYVDSTDGEWVACRGGDWDNAASAGVFALSLDSARSYVNTYIGFRAAFCPL